jgi:hypothetical protein
MRRRLLAFKAYMAAVVAWLLVGYAWMALYNKGCDNLVGK